MLYSLSFLLKQKGGIAMRNLIDLIFAVYCLLTILLEIAKYIRKD